MITYLRYLVTCNGPGHDVLPTIATLAGVMSVSLVTLALFTVGGGVFYFEHLYNRISGQ